MMKSVLITGAARGIGLALVNHFLSQNWKVIATDNNESPLLAIKHDNLQVFHLDVREIAEWDEVFLTLNTLDVIINNAGVIIPSFIDEIEFDDANIQIDINLKGVINGSTFAAKKMLHQGHGHIINISSLAGVAPIQGLPIYAATKAAVRSFSLSICHELKQRNVDVSVVYPDLVDTNMLTVQLDYDAAAMTFSGNKTLSTSDIVKAIFEDALKNKQLEIMIPHTRGWIAQIGNLFPRISGFLTDFLSKKGLKNLRKARLARNTH